MCDVNKKNIFVLGLRKELNNIFFTYVKEIFCLQVRARVLVCRAYIFVFCAQWRTLALRRVTGGETGRNTTVRNFSASRTRHRAIDRSLSISRAPFEIASWRTTRLPRALFFFTPSSIFLPQPQYIFLAFQARNIVRVLYIYHDCTMLLHCMECTVNA